MLDVVYTWQPPFAVAGARLPISFSLTDPGADPSVAVHVTGIAPLDAIYDITSRTWQTTIPVPADASNEIAVTVELNSADFHSMLSAPMNIPVAHPGDPIMPTIVEMPAEETTTFSWGNGRDQVGTERPDGDGSQLLPTPSRPT